MTARHSERGTALLTVLLLVAVIATISATALDRIGIATRLAGNVATVAQARAWLSTAEYLAAARIEDLRRSDEDQTTLAGNWMGVERSIALPDGGLVRARVMDGGNCFNLNSLVDKRADDNLVAREEGGRQFAALMTSLGIGAGEAAQIADMATDYIDSDQVALRLGGEDSAYAGTSDALPANQLMADPSELRAVARVSARDYRLLERWLCALPVTTMSPLNVNTLLPEQAPLLAMLAPGVIDLARARAQLASRPAAGYGSVLQFWKTPPFEGLQVPTEATGQVQVRTDFFTLQATVEAGSARVAETALIDASEAPARIVRRQWGEAN